MSTNITNITLCPEDTWSILNLQLDVLIISSFFYIVIFITGVIGNIMVIYVLFKEKELKSFTNYLLANLSFADLMVLFTCVPSAFHDLFANNKWYLGKFMCYSFEFSQYCTSITSILSLFMITTERYYVICKPLSFKSVVTKSRTVKTLFLIWSISVVINLPLIFFTNYEPISTCIDRATNTIVQEYKCEMIFDEKFNNWHIYFILTIAFFVYFILGIVLIFMYYKISKHLKKSQEMLNLSSNKKSKCSNNRISLETGCFVDDGNAETTINNIKDNLHELESLQEQNNDKSSINRVKKLPDKNSLFLCKQKDDDFEKFIKPRKQLIFMLMSIIIVFYVCVYPIKILSLINVFYQLVYIFSERTLSYVVMAARILFYMNSSINPILYNCLSKKFRVGFKKLLIFRICFDKEIEKK